MSVSSSDNTRELESLRERLVRLEDRLTAIDNKVLHHIAKVEKTLIEQSVVVTTLSQRAVDSEVNLQRLISAVEKLFERADPAKLRDLSLTGSQSEPSAPDSVFRPRIIKEDEDQKRRHRKPLTRL
jgi:hypothetical protein